MDDLTRIWTDPRATFAELLEHRPTHLFYPLAGVYWATHSLHLVLRNASIMPVDASPLLVAMANIAFGIFCGPLLFMGIAHLVHQACRLFGGTGDAGRVRAALAWSSVPYGPLFVLLLPIFLLGPTEQILQSGQPYMQTLLQFGTWGAVHGFYQLIRLVLVIWSLIIGLVTISEAESISMGKVALAHVVLIVVFLGAVMLLSVIL